MVYSATLTMTKLLLILRIKYGKMSHPVSMNVEFKVMMMKINQHPKEKFWQTVNFLFK